MSRVQELGFPVAYHFHGDVVVFYRSEKKGDKGYPRHEMALQKWLSGGGEPEGAEVPPPGLSKAREKSERFWEGIRRTLTKDKLQPVA